MFWPRLQLTKEEETVVSKYFNPDKPRRVWRKVYNGALVLNDVQRTPTFPFSIARRSKIMAMTGSGDLSQFRLQLQDSSGEQYFPTANAASNIFGGYSQLPGSVNYPPSPFTVRVGLPLTLCPFVFEPAIVLDPNQVLNLSAEGMGPYQGVDYRIEVCFHVWEFPGFYGTSPG